MKTKQLTPTDLIRLLSVAAVELYALGRLDAAEEVALIRRAVPMIAKAYPGADQAAAMADHLIQHQHDLMVSPPQTQNMTLVLDADELFLDPSGTDILQVVRALVEVLTLLPEQADRETIAALLWYMVDFWELEEHLSD